MSGSQTISTSETRIEALKLQSSAYGVTIPLVYGVTRIAGNLVWYGGFKAIPHTESSGGGKGGGVKTQDTKYTYSASVIMGICHGPISDLPRIWRGKKLYRSSTTQAAVVSGSTSFAVPAGSPGYQKTLPDADKDPIVTSVSVHGGSGEDEYTQTLAAGDDFTVEDGVITFRRTLYGSNITATVAYQYTTPGGVTRTAAQQLGLTYKAGKLGQSTLGFLTSDFPDYAIGYSGLAIVAGQDYDLGSGAQVDNHSFEVVGPMAYELGDEQPDVDISRALADALTNGRYGAGFPASCIGDWSDWSDYIVAAGLLMSPAITEQTDASELVLQAGKLTNTAPVWSGGKLKMVPYADATESGNGRTFTPNTVAVYALDRDEFIRGEGEPALVQMRKRPADCFNHVRVEFQQRSRRYDKAIAEATDQADIDTTSRRTMPTVSAPWFSTMAAARRSAQLIQQRSLYVRAEYVGTLPPNFALLEPMDLVVVTEPDLDLVDTPLRVTQVEEQSNGDLRVTFEDYPADAVSDVLYDTETSDGFLLDYNVEPGNVARPVFFEAPTSKTTTGLEVWAAVQGQSDDWGGCRVWVSLDGLEYQEAAVLERPSRYGTLQANAVATGTLDVKVSGKWGNASADDAEALQTLCFIGGDNPEYLAYQTATLTASGRYTLGGLVRGAYMTAAATHDAGDPIVRIDRGIAKSGPLELSMIGKRVYFKFTSFNVYGSGEQSLADVVEYSYRITGYMAKLPPAAPEGLTVTLEAFGARGRCEASDEPDVIGYEWRGGPEFATAKVLKRRGGTSETWETQPLGTLTMWVRARDRFGNYSAPTSASATVAPPVMTSVTASFDGPNIVLAYAAAAGSYAVAGFDILEGDSGADFADATLLTTRQSTRFSTRVTWIAHTYWVRSYDVHGNRGAPLSVDVSILAPPQVPTVTAQVIDNNVLLRWSVPTDGTLPVTDFIVRKGPTRPSAVLLGHTGTKTFTTTFEEVAGTFTYWVSAVDSSGTEGPARSVVATVDQPPDYVLRLDFNSTFGGTKTGMYVADGALYGPSFGETIAAHFDSRGWASPADQVAAGFPAFFQPSAASCSYEEVIDYGALLPSSTVTVTPNIENLAGAATWAIQLSYRATTSDAWVDGPANASRVQATNFRYVRARLTFTAAGGDDLVRVSALNFKLSAKNRTDQGSATAAAGDASGTLVNFNVAFVDVEAIQVTPQGTASRTPVVNFTDAPNPTSFRVLLFDSIGNRVSGPFTWTARGL